MPGNQRSVPWEELRSAKRRYTEDMTGWVMSEHGVPDSKWTVIKQDHIAHKKQGDVLSTYVYWECECSCENHTHKIISTRDIREGRSLSCGCAGEDKALSGSPNRRTNIYNLSGEYGIGYTTNTNEPFYFDLEDFDLIKNYCWFEHWPFPHYRALMANIRLPNGTTKSMRFHQVLGCKGYDHINHNTFDNRRSNLRPCTQHQNTFNARKKKNNSTGIIGVCSQKECPGKPWRARIMVNRKEILLGTYENFDDAVRARLEGEKKYFGEFAPQKHLFAQYGIEEDDKK